jgi:hypothetical protein
MGGGCRTDLGALVWCRAVASSAMRTRPPITITANLAVMMTSPWHAVRMPAPAHGCAMTTQTRDPRRDSPGAPFMTPSSATRLQCRERGRTIPLALRWSPAGAVVWGGPRRSDRRRGLPLLGSYLIIVTVEDEPNADARATPDSRKPTLRPVRTGQAPNRQTWIFGL